MNWDRVDASLGRLEKQLRDYIAKCGGEGGTPGPCPSGAQYESGGWHQSAVEARSLSSEAHEYSESELSKKANDASQSTNRDGTGGELMALHDRASAAHHEVIKDINAKIKAESDIGKKQSLALEASLHQKAAAAHDKAAVYFEKYRALVFNSSTRQRVS